MIIRKLTVNEVGGCNFCKRGVLSSGGYTLIYPYDTVYHLSNPESGGLAGNICDECVQQLIQSVTDKTNK